jgi:hypothetical protein
VRKAVLVLVCLSACACREKTKESPTAPSVSVTVIQNQGSNNSGNSPSPGPNNSCSGKPIVSTGISFLDERSTESIAVGETTTLNTTPKDSDGVSVSIPCGAPPQVNGWFAGPLSICEIVGDNQKYTPKIRGKAAGNCDVSVVVMPGIQASSRIIVQ